MTTVSAGAEANRPASFPAPPKGGAGERRANAVRAAPFQGALVRPLPRRARPGPRSRTSGGELLVSYDGEQFEFAVALRAGASGQHHQGLGAVLGVQELGVDVDAAEFGMED